jgi:predicted nucleic acid-binding protein
MTSGGAEPLFLDTNILVYANVAQAPLHQLALETIKQYAAAGHTLWISRQIVREYLATVTRQQRFATPMPMSTALTRVRYFLRAFNVAEDSSDSTDRLLVLLDTIPTGGS